MVERKQNNLKNVLLKDTAKEIKNTFKRFLSILLVVLLGVGFFAGIKVASPDMKITADSFFDNQNVMDIQVLSTLGLTDEDIDAFTKNVEGVQKAVGSYSQDVIVVVNDKENVMKLETITEGINELRLIEGKMAEEKDECVVEEHFLTRTGCKLGDTITIDAEKVTDDAGEEKNLLKQKEMKIVGVVQSPLYISMERGSSKLGSGKINYYMYVPKSAITQEIYTQIYLQVAGAKELKSYEDEYEDIVDKVKQNIEDISEERKQARYDKIYNTANDKIKDAQKELDKEKQKAQNEIKKAQDKINGAKQKIKNGKATLQANTKKADKEFAKLSKKLKDAQKELEYKKSEFEYSKEIAESQIQENVKLLEVLKAQGALQEQIVALENGINGARAELKEAESQLKIAGKEIENQKSKLESEKKKTYASLDSYKKELDDAEKEITKNENKLKQTKKDTDKKIKDAQKELENAKEDLKEIKMPEWYILDRNQNVGYASYMQDADRVANLASVFPVLFFVVAALISLTSMSRMVEEQRVQIGTLKALGYTKVQIASKYIIYALLATIIGSVIGLIIGFNVLPRIIANIYGMMYSVPETKIEFNMEYTIISVGLAALCTVGATIYSCAKELLYMPAVLMRPKSPKAGKRVFLEKIKFVWSHMSFTQKVTARNIFRYKKRFMMTIIGVMGCTALILSGFGLRDSISGMLPSQYGKIDKYQAQITLKDNIDKKTLQKEKDNLSNMEEIQNFMAVNIGSVEITSVENTQNIQLIVPEDTQGLSDFICLQSRLNKNEKYTLNEDGVVITEKLAKLLNLKVGDKIKIKNVDDVEVEVKLENITENYLLHYIYMSPKLYEKLYKEEFSPNTILVNTAENVNEDELGRKLLENEDTFAGVTFNSASEGIFKDIMDNMNLVVWILIIAAGLLAFVVLYNLANTNISERIRELATIKVLGFYDKEVYNYIGKEMNILSFIGMCLGLIAGYFLAMFIVKTTELDIVMFAHKVNFESYIYAILITVLFDVIVNIATYFSLKKIDMIQSLKSVE